MPVSIESEFCETLKRRGRILGYREHQILALITSDLKATGRVRSYDQIATALGMRHKSHVCDTIGRLERRGLLKRVRNGARKRITWPSQEPRTATASARVGAWQQMIPA